MLSRNSTMFFYLKKRSNYKTGRLPIYIRITVEGERMEISTKRECEPEKWNSQTGRKNGIKDDTRTLMPTWMLFNLKFMKSKGKLLNQIWL
ncbi:Arm DNA-binding domain-containing protein [Dyadobacter alkalitolerans]|uniref:Arm DNA-binding domain-containing protein n=1 Tax=Dyadobacter alkalitolerans TaxID=492736 RepID=UPI000479A440